MISRLLAACLGLFLAGSSLSAADLSANELAGRLSAARSEPATYVRLRMEIRQGGARDVLQVQIKERNGKNSTDLAYQVLFPKERKGETVLLKKSGNSVSGSVIEANGQVHPLEQLKQPLLGSDLSCEDVIDDFFAWDRQAIVGTDTINRTPCQILESKPGKGERSSYASVKTWVDSARLVPLRIEKYGSSGQLVRRITTTDVVKDAGRHIPAKLIVDAARKDSLTDLDGSKIKHDVNYTDQDFTPEGLKDVSAPK